MLERIKGEVLFGVSFSGEWSSMQEFIDTLDQCLDRYEVETALQCYCSYIKGFASRRLYELGDESPENIESLVLKYIPTNGRYSKLKEIKHENT